MAAALVCVFLGAVDLTVVASILPGMIGDLGVNTADIDRYIWAVNAYLIAYIVAIPLAGSASDLIGRLPAFIGSLLIFLAGSIACATGDTLTELIIGRAIQGFGGGGLLPVAIALAGDTLGRSGQLAGIGFVSAVETIGWIVGPIYGAVVTEAFGGVDEPWRWVFWINVPILAVLVLAVRKLSARTTTMSLQGVRQLDYTGIALLSIALTTLNLALASGGELGVGTGSGLRALGGTENPLADRVPLLLGIAVTSLVALVFWELRATRPLLPVRLYRYGPYMATILANLCLGAVLMVAMVNVPIVVALGADRDRVGIESALLLAPFTIAVAAVSLLAGGVERGLGEGRAMLAGLALAAVGSFLVAPFAGEGNQLGMVWGLLVMGAGAGLLLPPLGSLPIQISASTERGSAAGSALMFRLLGMTVGISTLTAIGVRRLQVLTGRLEPVVREPDESTASFLLRQQQFIIDHAIPLSRQVVQETFLAAAAISIAGVLPVLVLVRYLRARTV